MQSASDSSPEAKADATEKAAGTASATASGSQSTAAEEPIGEPQEYEVNAEGLLAGALPESMLKEGWVSLFDGSRFWMVHRR